SRSPRRDVYVGAMVELALTRSAEDRRRFDLAGYGSVRRLGTSIAVVDLTTLDGSVLRTDRTGIWRPVIRATDAVGSVVGEYRALRASTSSGELTWRGLAYRLTTGGWTRARFALERDGEPVLRLRCASWGRRPVSVTVDDPTAEAALVLFVVSVARIVVAESDA